MQETSPDESGGRPDPEVGFGLVEAVLALAGALAAALSGDATYAAAGFGAAVAVLASRLASRSADRARRLALVLWAAVAATIVLLLTGQAVPAALVAVSALVAATLIVVRAARPGEG